MSFDLTKVDNQIDMLESSLQSQGIKCGHRGILDLGSKEWQDTPEKIKAIAYQSLIQDGWSEGGITDIMTRKYKHLSESTMQFTFKKLNEYAEKHPVEAEDSTSQSGMEIKKPSSKAKK